jgi:malonyl-CoA O-methyltransferase
MDETAALDPAAVALSLRRLLRAPQPPWLHREVARRMAERLEFIRLQPALILDWWGAVGAGGEHLAQRYPQARRVLVEPDAAWAERSRAALRTRWWRAAHWTAPRVEVCLESEEVPGDAQLIWSNMMLHAVDARPLFLRWQRLLQPEGFVMFSCLGPGSLRELRELYRRLGWGTPAPDYIDMHDLGDLLLGAGFADPVMDQETLTLTWTDAEQALAELRSLGRNAAPAREPGLHTPRWRTRLLRELESLRGADGRIALGFEIAYGHAFKPLPLRQRRQHSTTFSEQELQEMRDIVRGVDDGAIG